jgi:hypothetical protein
MVKKYMKKCSVFLAIKGIQIKITLRFHLTPVRMATIKNINNKLLVRMWGKWNHHTLLVGM